MDGFTYICNMISEMNWNTNVFAVDRAEMESRGRSCYFKYQ